jgi:hypothetical protein
MGYGRGSKSCQTRPKCLMAGEGERHLWFQLPNAWASVLEGHRDPSIMDALCLLFSGVRNKVEHGRLWEALAGGQVQAYGGTVHVNNRLLHHQNSHMEKVSFVTLDRPGISNCKMLKQDNSDCSCYKFAKVLCHWERSRTESLLPISWRVKKFSKSKAHIVQTWNVFKKSRNAFPVWKSNYQLL